MTAPGAPSTGLAVPENTPPSPSPIHHTPTDQAIEAPRATFTVGRQAMPSPRPTWSRANDRLVITAWCPMVRPDQVIGRAITDGRPCAPGAIIWVPKDRVKKYA